MSQQAVLTPEFKLHIEQGVTFDHTFQWLSGGMFMAPIEDLIAGYPTIITVTNHQVNSISAHPVIISGVEGCPHINTEDVGIPLLTRLSADTLSVPLTTQGDVWVPGTGEITYHHPTDLTGYTGKCVIRKNWYTTTAIHTMTTANGGIILNPIDGSIQLVIPKDVTAAFNFTHAVYDVDLTLGSYDTRVFKGPVEMYREISI